MKEINKRHLAAWNVGKKIFGYTGDLPKPRGLLIGEAPGPNTNAKLPLFPSPAGSAAGRLLSYANIHAMEWMGKLVRVNQCGDEQWSSRAACAGRVAATSFFLDPKNFHDGKPLRVLLLGADVARAWSCYGPFGKVTWIFSDKGDMTDAVRVEVAWIPHPSGRNLIYNERKNQLRAGRAVRWAIGERDQP